MSGPFELLGDPDAAACEGDVCALPTDQQDADRDTNDESTADRSTGPLV